LSYDSEFDEDEEDQWSPPIKTKKKPKPPRKTSYEGHAEVQRWLKEQALGDEGVKPEFNPTFLASRRDGPWILSSLAHFYEEDLITDVLQAVKSGKEASVYCCAAHPATGAEYLAAKVYRPRLFRSLCILRNIALFLESGRIHGDLSEYNILYWRGAVSIIDFAQAVDPQQNPAVFPLLLRDIERVCGYFARYGVVADPRALARDMWNQEMGALF
jgi:serine/threonine-protein kinase RIO1